MITMIRYLSALFCAFQEKGKFAVAHHATEGRNLAQAAHPGAVPLVRALSCSKWGCYSKHSPCLTLPLTCCITQQEGSRICLVLLCSPLSLISQGSNGLSLHDSLREL